MSPVWVVPCFDETEDRVPCLGRRAEAPPIQQFTLQRREEALRHRIVVTVAHAAARWPHTHLTAALPEGQRRVLRTVIRVMDHTIRPSLLDSHVERLEHELRPQMRLHRPAHHAATE